MSDSTANETAALPEADEVHLRDYWLVVLRRKRIVMLAFFLVLALVTAYTFMKKPVFEATSTLEVKEGKQGDKLLDISLGGETNLADEIELLRSRTMARRVVAQLGLQWQSIDEPDDASIELQSLEVTAPHPRLDIIADGGDRYQVRLPDGNLLGTGTSGRPLTLDGLQIFVELHGAKRGDRLTLERIPFENLFLGIKSSLRVAEVGKNTSIIRLAYRHTDPVLASEFVNTLARIYFDESIAEKAQEAGKAAGFIDDQLGGIEHSLSQSEKKLHDFKLKSGLLTLGPEGQALVEKLAEIEKQKMDLGFRQKSIAFAIKELKKALDSRVPFNPPAITGVPVAQEGAEALAQLQAEKKALLLDFTEAHPDVIALNEKILQVELNLLSAYKSSQDSLQAQSKELDKTISDYDIELQKVPEAELELAGMTRDAEVNAELYTFLLQKQQEAKIAEASTISNVQIIDPAIIPLRPVKPNKKKNLLLGVILGLMLGVGLAFFLEYLDDSVRDATQLKRILGQPVLGLVPRLGGAKGSDTENTLISSLSPKDPAVEAFRALRTSLKYASAKEKRQVIMITSALPGEGKTSISSNLALVLAHEGAKVVIVGCDLRRPSLAARFSHRNSPGLSDFLVGESNVVLRKTNTTGLDLISAGTIPPNPAELLATEKMAELIEKLRQRYDYILLDAPPALLVTDAQVLSPLTDMVITVSEACQVPAKAVRQMRETLRAVNAPVIGAILNDKTGRGTYYYGNYGYYGYGYYGEEEQAAKGIAGLAERAWKFING